MYHHKTSKRETLLLMDFSKEPFECKMAAYDVGVHTRWQVGGFVCPHAVWQASQ
jgi:hypothetical protein